MRLSQQLGFHLTAHMGSGRADWRGRTKEASPRPEVLDPLVQRQGEREAPDAAPGDHLVDHGGREGHVDVREDAMVAREADEVPEGLQQDVEETTEAAT